MQSVNFTLLPPSGWGNDNDMRVVDVKYDEYALVHTIKTKGSVSTVLNKLYGTVITPVSTHCPFQLQSQSSTLTHEYVV